MTYLNPCIDLTINSNPQISNRILSGTKDIFSTVKEAPLALRTSFPKILRNNNFSVSVFTSKQYIFIEVSSKLNAMQNREKQKSEKYKTLFLPQESLENVAFIIDNAKMIRVGGLKITGGAPFKIGTDVSLCVWDLSFSNFEKGRTHSEKIDLLYLISFGNQLREDNAWQELEALIRVTIDGWMKNK